jgi:hypothetical protein
VAGTILLNNMSSISMIPIELRKRRLERAVLTQVGDELDDAALRELATGPVIRRLHLSANRPDGLAECTREMFSLAMLVRLGKVTEQDIRESFAAFRRLDVNDEGVLNSKSIIAAMVKNRQRSAFSRSTSGTNLQSLGDEQVHDDHSQHSSVFWQGPERSLHVATAEGEYIFNRAEPLLSAEEIPPFVDNDTDPRDNSARSFRSSFQFEEHISARPSLQRPQESPF